MKYLFGAVLLALVTATTITTLIAPDTQSDVPVLYWVTDNNPARVEQINKFHNWLVKNGYTAPGDPTKPLLELRVDSANCDVSKVIIQGVSGVGGDIIDIWSGGGNMIYFKDVGLLYDVTDDAKRLKFDPSMTWPAIVPEITADGEDGLRHQYMFPCNVCAHQYWVNEATFRKYGLSVPPQRWTFEQFERMGKEFVEIANRGKKFRDAFFANAVSTGIMFRSLGLSSFNETLTRCTLNDPRYVKVLKLKHKWIYTDRILPSPSDVASFATEGSYGDAMLQLFNNGNYAMFWTGRYALIKLREFGSLDLSVSEPPHGGFPNTSTGTRAAGVYAGGKHKDLAVLFLAFLASEDYNMQIVDDADALPPNPKYTNTPQFSEPKKYPNEWGSHDRFANAMRNITIGSNFSPFVSKRTAVRMAREAEQTFLSGLASAEAVAKDLQERVNQEVRRTVDENPRLRPRYEKLLVRQKQIDEMVKKWRRIDRLQAQGLEVPTELADSVEKIPLKWIENVFYRRYYTYKGWAE